MANKQVKYINLLHIFSVNFRGSLGFGQDSVDSLPGNIGTQDVKDCQVNYSINTCFEFDQLTPPLLLIL